MCGPHRWQRWPYFEFRQTMRTQGCGTQEFFEGSCRSTSVLVLQQHLASVSQYCLCACAQLCIATFHLPVPYFKHLTPVCSGIQMRIKKRRSLSPSAFRTVRFAPVVSLARASQLPCLASVDWSYASAGLLLVCQRSQTLVEALHTGSRTRLDKCGSTGSAAAQALPPHLPLKPSLPTCRSVFLRCVSML
jgi:hypothetical protein